MTLHAQPASAPDAHALAQADAARYRDDGFLRPVQAMTTAEAAAHRSAFEALEAAHAGPDNGGLPHPMAHYARVGAHLAFDLPLRAALDPRVVDPVASILGPDVMLWACEYFVKEAGSPKIVSWHQDITYWGMGETDHEVTAWIAISDATPASGCMRFVPGSHKQSVVEHVDTFAEDNLLSRGQEIAVEVNEADAVDDALMAGEMSLHHGRVFHASGPNVSDDRRIALVLRFIRPDTPATGKGADYAMLVRGADRHRTRINLAPPAGAFTPAHLALHDEVTGQQKLTLTDGAAQKVGLYGPA